MESYILIYLLLIINTLLIIALFFRKTKQENNDDKFQHLKELIQQQQQHFLQLFNQHIKEQKNMLDLQHTQIQQQLQQIHQQQIKQIKDITTYNQQFNNQMTNYIQHLKQDVNEHLSHLRLDNAQQLDQMRATVDEKLQKTLNERLAHSFEIVNKQLMTVQEGLGAMQHIANDVGGLKKVLSNVKLRGGIGEVQLGMILEQILSADQYGYQVKVNPHENTVVEYAIKLPGQDHQEQIWVPIDSKFPKDTYEHLLTAYDSGDPQQILLQQKNLEQTLKKMAKDIHDKYIHPPFTTGFGILFLPFESIYAEVIRNSSLVDQIQQQYNVVITGPNTITALLNSLQMGFKTLAIQKRSQEVWQVLAGVKKEFSNFEMLITKAHNNIQTGLNQLDDLVGKRTRAINRQLKDITNDTNLIE